MLKAVTRDEAELFELPGRKWYHYSGPALTGAEHLTVGFAIFQSGSILIGNGLGIFTGEWKGASSKSKTWLAIALSVLVVGIVVVSIGNAKMP